METAFAVSLHQSFTGESRRGANFIKGLGDSRMKRGGVGNNDAFLHREITSLRVLEAMTTEFSLVLALG